jgi:hypothetical protein
VRWSRSLGAHERPHARPGPARPRRADAFARPSAAPSASTQELPERILRSGQYTTRKRERLSDARRATCKERSMPKQAVANMHRQHCHERALGCQCTAAWLLRQLVRRGAAHPRWSKGLWIAKHRLRAINNRNRSRPIPPTLRCTCNSVCSCTRRGRNRSPLSAGTQ